MPSVAVDTGLLVAILSKDDDDFLLAQKFFQKNSGILITNLPVLTEAAYLLSRRPGAAADLLRWVAKTFDIDKETAIDLPRIVEIMTKYADLPADFADASLLAMCERRGLSEIATFDKDFDVYQMASGTRLQNVIRS